MVPSFFLVFLAQLICERINEYFWQLIKRKYVNDILRNFEAQIPHLLGRLQGRGGPGGVYVGLDVQKEDEVHDVADREVAEEPLECVHFVDNNVAFLRDVDEKVAVIVHHLDDLRVLNDGGHLRGHQGLELLLEDDYALRRGHNVETRPQILYGDDADQLAVADDLHGGVVLGIVRSVPDVDDVTFEWLNIEKLFKTHQTRTDNVLLVVVDVPQGHVLAQQIGDEILALSVVAETSDSHHGADREFLCVGHRRMRRDAVEHVVQCDWCAVVAGVDSETSMVVGVQEHLLVNAEGDKTLLKKKKNVVVVDAEWWNYGIFLFLYL